MRFRVWMPQATYQRAGFFGDPVPFPHGYDAVGVIEAAHLEAAYRAGQNLDGPCWNPERPTRSLSVGDVLTTEDGAWRVAIAGFTALGDSADPITVAD